VNEGGNARKGDLDVWWNNGFIQRVADFGGQGVPIFFSLTGFLLGRLLLKEFQNFGKISIRSFFMRRILRIWPLYFFFLMLCLAANPFASNTPAINASEIPFYLTFTYNWGQLYFALPGSMATITWSVSVEEQIYFVLPFLLSLQLKNRFRVISTLLICIGSFSLILSAIDLLPGSTRSTLSYFLPVGVGLMLSMYEDIFRRNRVSDRFTKWLVFLLAILYVLVFPYFSQSKFGDLISMVFTSILFVALLFLADKFISPHNIVYKFLSHIGRISYGCYLYHWAIWTVMTGKGIFYSDITGFSFFGVVIALLATLLLSEISYRVIEQPFLRMRKRYQKVDSP